MIAGDDDEFDVNPLPPYHFPVVYVDEEGTPADEEEDVGKPAWLTSDEAYDAITDEQWEEFWAPIAHAYHPDYEPAD